MIQTEVLGTRLYVAGFALLGYRPPADMAWVLQQVVALVGMQTGGLEPKVWSYPLPDGAGGLGETICQPLVESFIVSDAWPELKVKGRKMRKTYVVMASCRQFNPQAVAAYLEKEVGKVWRLGLFEL